MVLEILRHISAEKTVKKAREARADSAAENRAAARENRKPTIFHGEVSRLNIYLKVNGFREGLAKAKHAFKREEEATAFLNFITRGLGHLLGNFKVFKVVSKIFIIDLKDSILLIGFSAISQKVRENYAKIFDADRNFSDTLVAKATEV